ncbi:hypothetical protein STCU_07435 [Strigomonas culicis]|uniref:Large ribosomal subunit protein mL43 n=2 Tax=Strigomonas culicis TaxID=28005 RepID=S9VKU8_9TRYP|nr:hypothetical protein STCU_08579 [Strigomonas culicis]EPY23830.1 hypothetical protein STCU_07435 [Strigomonas culicis]|eukprot:EPY21367.1 hypothetical protein STCU_08579 [Strigomonas culicis]
MSRNGELCLKKIIISYSPSHGNPATRQFFATHLPAFKRQYPSVVIDIRPRFWPETSITGVYRDGSEKALNIKHLSSMGINARFHRLVNEANDSNEPFGATHAHATRRSVQGPWNPWLWGCERPRRRTPAAAWDRRLTEQEWDYYVGQYGAQMKAEEESIADQVRRYTDIPDAGTAVVQQRWRDYVLPRMQTDLEHNLAHLKRERLRGAPPPAPPHLHEYSLFSVPNHSLMGQDAVDELRRREAKYEEDWWRRRKEQLRPPQ